MKQVHEKPGCVPACVLKEYHIRGISSAPRHAGKRLRCRETKRQSVPGITFLPNAIAPSSK
jgi:hypothetical protein